MGDHSKTKAQLIAELEEMRGRLAAREGDDLFRVAVENSQVGFYVLREDSFLYVNQALADLFGYEREELQRDVKPMDLVHPEDRLAAVAVKRLHHDRSVFFLKCSQIIQVTCDERRWHILRIVQHEHLLHL